MFESETGLKIFNFSTEEVEERLQFKIDVG